MTATLNNNTQQYENSAVHVSQSKEQLDNVDALMPNLQMMNSVNLMDTNSERIDQLK